MRTLDEHRVRVELAQQLANPERERRVEEHAVEEPRTERRHEREQLVAERRSRGRAREHVHVELARHGVELELLGRRQRQLVAASADEEEAGLHAPAVSRSSSSRRP